MMQKTDPVSRTHVLLHLLHLLLAIFCILSSLLQMKRKMSESGDPTTDRINPKEFYEKTLGNPKLIAAPMVDQSELAFRMLLRKYGAQLCYTPMVHALNFVNDLKYRKNNFSTNEHDRPLIVQFCANDPETFLKAAKLVENDCDAVDLNLGCPQGIAKRGHYGSFLQDEWDLIYNIIKLASNNLKVPVTAKIRIFKDIKRTIEYAKMLESAGCSMIAVHGRHRDQKGISTGLADWSIIKLVKDAVNIPVIGNGNISFRSDVDNCLKLTNADGVMSAEGILYNPPMFSGRHIPSWTIGEEYLTLFKMYHKLDIDRTCLRSHLFKILHFVLKIEGNEDLRQKLSTARHFEDFESIIGAIKNKYEDKDGDNQEIVDTSSLPLPFYVCQPYFRKINNPIVNENGKSDGTNQKVLNGRND